MLFVQRPVCKHPQLQLLPALIASYATPAQWTSRRTTYTDENSSHQNLITRQPVTTLLAECIPMASKSYLVDRLL